MHIPFAVEVMPFLVASLALFGGIGIVAHVLGCRRTAKLCYLLAIIASGYMLYFFRDPQRPLPTNPMEIMAGADGTVAQVKDDVYEETYLKTNTVRVSIFLSLISVHVNRAPIAGTVKSAGYFPGKRFFTFEEKSSLYNQHSAILIEGAQTKCLVKQIVGPIARRVVYWLEPGQVLVAGERIGMMKFGSRLDMYFPKSDVDVVVKPGDKTAAGLTVVARIKPNGKAALEPPNP